jgi:plasmid stabilization system protein ParE
VIRQVRIEPEAAAELEDAAHWYDTKRAGLGSEFLASVDMALERIANWPQAARLVDGVAPDLAVRKAPVPRFPYHIAYLEKAEAIRILAPSPTTGARRATGTDESRR